MTRVAAAVAISVAVMSLVGCKEKAPAVRVNRAQPVTVQLVQVESVDLERTLAGRTSALEVAEVRPQVGGILEKRLFVEGAEVKAGDQLYQIESASYEASLASAEANVLRCEATLTNARATARRYANLVKANAVSRQDYDNAVAAVKVAEADVAVAKAAVRTAQINVDYTKVRAPISGRVSRSEVTPGALMTAHQANRMTSVTQLDPMYVDLVQASSDMLRMRHELERGSLKAAEGEASFEVKLILEDGSVYPQKGKLTFSDVTVGQDTGTVNMRAIFPNPKRELMPGMYVRAVIAEGSRPTAMMVAQRALMRNNHGDPYVYTIADGKVVQTMVEVDRAVGDSWLLTSGLQPGDKVIYDGVIKIRPGMPVAVSGTVDAHGKPVAADKQ